MKYPIYKQTNNGKDVHKILSEGECLSIQTTKNFTKVLHTHNSLYIADLVHSDHAEIISKETFEKAYVEAINKFSKANLAQ